MTRVLLVGDQREDSKRLEALLRKAGDVVARVPDGAAALEQLAAQPPEILVTDLLMPRLDGFELIWEVRGRPELRDLLIIVHPGIITDPEDRVLCEGLGADAVLSRPDDPNACLAEIGQLWQARAAGQLRPGVQQLSEVDYLRGHLRRLKARLDPSTTELAERGRLLTELADRTDDIIFKVDPTGRIHFVNRAIETLTGMPADQVIGRTAIEIAQALRLPEVVERIKQHPSGPGFFQYEIALPRPDGKTTHLELRTHSVVVDGKLASIEGIARDTTERHALLTAVEDAKAETEFCLDLMGHDLQNFNQTAQGYLEYFLLSLPPDTPQLRYVENVLQQLRTSSKFVDDLRRLVSYRRLAPENLSLRDLGGLLMESVGRVHRAAARPAARVELGPVPEPNWVRAADALHDLVPLLVDCAGGPSGPPAGPLSLTVGGELSGGRRFNRLELTGPSLHIRDEVRWGLETPEEKLPANPRRPDLPVLALRSLLRVHEGQVWVQQGAAGQGETLVVLLPKAEEG